MLEYFIYFLQLLFCIYFFQNKFGFLSYACSLYAYYEAKIFKIHLYLKCDENAIEKHIADKFLNEINFLCIFFNLMSN